MVADISPPELAARQAELFTAPSHVAASMMIGWTLTMDGVGGRIVETEAYHYSDPASHSFSGPTPRNAVMFGPPGAIYVYRSYGIHWCMNLVCGDERGSAVLLRAVEPTQGLDLMAARRGLEDPRLLCSGPGRLCQALGVSHAQNGLRVDAPPFALVPGPAAGVVVGPRIGISKAVDVPWRFGERGSRFVSKPFPKAG
ncbi:DNA-3-methyladenine glycosylase [Phenylobacterium sp.]|jgi:DNA-3-methyladenine glycosylase|uniref:DNA-3-methyladenine glycosylase n=1 Tax=Phenylobacterium sp. TaxID=1871053 RepID=UPI002F40FB04